MERVELSVLIEGLKMRKVLPYAAQPALSQSLKNILASGANSCRFMSFR